MIKTQDEQVNIFQVTTKRQRTKSLNIMFQEELGCLSSLTVHQLIHLQFLPSVNQSATGTDHIKFLQWKKQYAFMSFYKN